ncbi:MAG: hypothetical protein ACK4X1_11675, partial [Terricaulis sp.]
AGDEAGVRGLYRDYAGDMANTPDADAFEIVAAGITADGAAIRDVARAVARTDLLGRFIDRLRARMTEQASQTAAANTPAAPPNVPPPAPQPQAALPAPISREEAGA